MKVLVTGATGFIGGRLLQRENIALVRRPSGYACERIGEIEDLRALQRACEGVDTIYHCAGYANASSSADEKLHWRVNYEGTKNLLQAAASCGVSRFVFLSSVKAMGDPGDECIDENWPGAPMSSYGQSKRAAEAAVLEAGVKFGFHSVNLRLAMVYGRGSRGSLELLARGLRAGWFPRLPNTGNKRSLVHIDDVVKAIRLVAERPEANGKTYIVSDSRQYSGREICDLVLSLSPPPPFSWSIPSWCLRFGGKVGDAIGLLQKGKQFPLNSQAVSRLIDSECYLPFRIENELGWRAEIPLVDGLREMLITNGTK